jgi:hypothetical protein
LLQPDAIFAAVGVPLNGPVTNGDIVTPFTTADAAVPVVEQFVVAFALAGSPQVPPKK